MNKLTVEKQAQVIKCLIEGNSIRSTVRMTGVAKNTIQKLLLEVGQACKEYHDKHVKNLTCSKVQVDEIWSFCYAKKRNLPDSLKEKDGFGDVWTFTAIDADSKLAVSWLVAQRNTPCAWRFMDDIRSRVANRIQLSTDGFRAYFFAVSNTFGTDIDYATINKIYGKDSSPAGRYSPPVCLGVNKEVITGSPDPKHVSTSYVERQNLTMRMSMRRFTRLTNAFSKKVENMKAAVNLHFMYYNFCRIHQSLRITPAMTAKVTDHVWEIEELLGLIKSRQKAA